MADIKINDLTAYTDPVSTDVLPIVDVGSDITKKVSIADLLENAGTGSAAAPSFSFDGDNNTGIYRPAADQVALTAGGTQALLAESTGITIPGNLTVSGTTTTIDTTTLVVEDKNIEMGAVTTPTDVTADGGGITLKGATDKTINWVNSTDAWTLSEHVNIASAKEFRIAGTKVLDATSLGSAVVGSSLTSVGTIGTGVWNGTAIATAYIADSAVTSAKIADGTIINADVNASAAIAGTKISPDFGSQAVTTTGLISADGKVSFPLGTAALPSLYPGSDTNTGIYSPGADQVAISTNGTQRLAIDSSGNVGIGTSSPSRKLQVNSSTTDTVALFESSDADCQINFQDSTSSADGVSIGCKGDNFYIRSGLSTERLRIDSSGRLGIGTSSPSVELSIAGSDPQLVLWEGTDGASSSKVQLGTGAAQGFVNIHKGDGTRTVQINSDGTTFFNGGNVGIGTTSPGANLHVQSSAGAGIRIQAGSTNDAQIDLIPGGTSNPYYIYVNNSRNLIFQDFATERARIDSSGRLLVGTSTAANNYRVTGTSYAPQVQLVSTTVFGLAVNRTNGDANISIANSSTATNNGTIGRIVFNANDGANLLAAAHVTAQVDGTPGTNDMPGRLVFSTTADGASSPTERLRIGSSGNISIGTTANTNKLRVHEGSDNANIFIVTGADESSEFLSLGINSGVPTVTAGGVGSTSSELAFRTADSGTETERMRIDSSGNVGIGTTSPISELHIEKATQAHISVKTASSNMAKFGSKGNDVYIAGTAGATNVIFKRNVTSTDHPADSGTETARIDSSGNVGIGTTSPTDHGGYGGTLEISGSPGGALYLTSSTDVGQLGMNSSGLQLRTRSAKDILFTTNNSERARIDSSGNVGISTTSPKRLLHLNGGSETVKIQITNTSTGSSTDGDGFQLGIATDGTAGIEQRENADLTFATNNTERMRIDSSGRLLVGTSTARTNYDNSSGYGPLLNLEGTSNSNRVLSFIHNDNSGGPLLVLGSTGGSTAGSNDLVAAQSTLGFLSWQGADGTDLVEAASIACQVDGTPGANDMPGRLVFSTTADGASSPTERMRITSGGEIRMANVNGIDVGSASDVGVVVEASGTQIVYRAGNPPLYVGRQTDEGTLISLRQAGAEEGTISVSGTTVSYNGAHLSRWSQLPSGAERTEILRGSVLSNIDEMCEWGEEDNEQLNRMKVSDVEGDKNVSGVFQAWDDDDDTYVNDFYCAMTGDFVIRIAQGTTVARGDLLMSAGDGTAKPQDDDIVRSKTIAKVTSTTVSTTYADNSYCVPCVLMAC